jgi:ribosomal 50S subunit-associated protein YjgA (DUF615 family)
VTPLRRTKRGEAIVAETRCEKELVVKVQLALTEIAFDVLQRLELESGLVDRVLDRQRHRADESFALRRQLPIPP